MIGLINLRVVLVNLLENHTTALHVDKIFYTLFVFSLPIYIRFVHTFLKITGRQWLEISFLVFSAIISITTQTDKFITGLHVYPFGRIEIAGPAYHIFILGSALTALYCMYVLIHALGRTNNSHQKNRIKYILGGMGLSAILLLSHYLPVSGISIYPLSSLSFVPALILSVGVFKYDLLDIGTVIRQGTIYLVLTGSLAGFYILVIYVFHVLFVQTGHGTSIAPPLLFAALIVLIFDPLRKRIQSFIDHFIFKGKYDYQKVLKEVSRKMTSLLDLDDISRYLLPSISDAMQIETAHLFIRYDDSGVFIDFTAAGITAMPLKADHALVRQLQSTMTPLNNLMFQKFPLPERNSIEEMADRLKVVLFIPMLSKNELIGFIAIGEKKSGELFVNEDLELLTTIANQTAVAVENAKNYREIESLNRDLETRIKQRTEDLARAVEEKDRARDRLIRSESLAAIGQLVAGTAHEINNPISSASSLIQTCLESMSTMKRQEDQEIIEDLRFSVKELQRTKGIIDSLLSLSRQNENYTEPVDIHSVIDDAFRVLYNQYKYLDIKIVKNYSQNLPAIQGNFAGAGTTLHQYHQKCNSVLKQRQGNNYSRHLIRSRIGNCEGLIERSGSRNSSQNHEGYF